MISAHPARRALAAAIVLAAAPGCEVVEKARDRFGTTDTLSIAGSGTGLMLGLQAGGRLRAGEEGVLRLSVTNRSDTTVADIRLELIVPAWAEPLPPRPGDREVSMVALDEGATRFSYGMEDTPIEPGQREMVEQRIRMPAAGGPGESHAPSTRLVRGRLLDADGVALAEVQGELVIGDGTAGESTGGTAAADRRDQMGTVRLGMTRSALSEIVPSARDTTWTRDDAAQRAAWVPVGSEGRALAWLSGDSVVRLEAREPAVRTRERLGVGSTLGQLRSAYGAACAKVEDGDPVVWFARAPGIHFALDASVPDDAAGLSANPGRLADTARVTRWWLERDVERCPR